MTGDTVVVYTQPHCAPCREVERFLASRGVPYEIRDVFADPEALEELATRGYMATPITRIGSDWIVGFRRGALLAALEYHRMLPDTSD